MQPIAARQQLQRRLGPAGGHRARINAAQVASVQALAAAVRQGSGPCARAQTWAHVAVQRREQRGPVPVAAAAGGQPEEEEADVAEFEALLAEVDALSYDEMKKRLRALGLSATGKKQELADRLAGAIWQQQQADAAAGGGGAEESLDSADVLAELAAMPTDELVGALGEMGLPTDGTRSELIQRLADALQLDDEGAYADEGFAGAEEEEADRMGAGRGGGTDMELDPELRAEFRGGSPARSSPGRADSPEVGSIYSSLSAEDKRLLLAVRTSQAFQDIATMPRTEVLRALRELLPGQQDPATRNDPATALAKARAAAQLDSEVADARNDQRAMSRLIKEAAALRQSGGAPAVKPAPSSVASDAVPGPLGEAFGVPLTEETADPRALLLMTATQLRRLKVDELKVACRALGLSDEGNRYECCEKVVRHVQGSFVRGGDAGAASDASSTPTSIRDMVSALGLRALRQQLVQRDLESTGSRAALEARLVAAMMQEKQLEGGEGEGREGDGDEDYEEVELEAWSPSLRVVQEDPPLMVAVVFGAPGGSMSDIEASLEAARTASDGLSTAWPYDARFGKGEKPPATDGDDEGVAVRLLYATAASTSGSSSRQGGVVLVDLGTTGLTGITAADLASGVALANKKVLGSAQALSQALSDTSALLCTTRTNALPAAQASELGSLLQGCGVPLLGGGVGVDASVTNKLLLRQRLSELQFPVLPCWRMTPADATPAAAASPSGKSGRGASSSSSSQQQEQGDAQPTDQWVSGFEAWVDKQGYHPERQAFIIKPAAGTGARDIIPARGVQAAAAAAAALVLKEAERQGQAVGKGSAGGQRGGRGGSVSPDSAAAAVVIEPLLGASENAVHFTVTVLDGPDGPLALGATEVEVSDVEEVLFRSELTLKALELQKEGHSAEEVDEVLARAEAAGLAADAETVAWSHSGYQPFTRVVKYHTPARLPLKLIHAVRHAAALAYSRMGLKGGARIDGWVKLQPKWQDAYDRYDDGSTRLLPDQDPEIMARVAQAVEEADAKFGPPLSDYYDHSKGFTYAVDLTKFNPKARLHASGNGQADVFVTDVNPGLDLDAKAPVFLQAAHVGLSHAALLRNLVNAALRPADGGASAAASSGKGSRAKTPASARSKSRSPSPGRAGDEVDVEAVRAKIAATEQALEAQPGTELPPLPPTNPAALVLAADWVPDSLDLAIGMTKWRTRQWLREAEERKHALERAQAALYVADVANSLMGEALGEIVPQRNAPSLAFADNWDPEFTTQAPAAQATLEPGYEDMAVPSESKGPARDQEALRELYPGLPDEDLMYIMLGQGPDGREIDTAMLQAKLQERMAAGITERPWGVLKECLVGGADEEEADRYNPEGQPYGMIGGGVFPTPAQVTAIMRAQNSYAHTHAAIKVWVLMGGDPEAAGSSLSSGLALMTRLAACEDVVVEPFLLQQGGQGRNEEGVRARCLARRTEWLTSGVGEEDLPHSLSLAHLRNMLPLEAAPGSEMVWALPYASLLQHGGEAVNSEAERALHTATTTFYALSNLEQQALEAQDDTQHELALAGLDGVGGLWGGEAGSRPTPPRCMSLGQLAREAARAGALVVPLVRGDMGTTGLIQQLLADAGAAYTGCAPATSALFGDKYGVACEVDSLEGEFGISAPPRQVLLTDLLVAAATDADLVQGMITELKRELLGLEPEDEGWAQAPLCFRPTEGAAGVGVAKILTATDLAVYCQALAVEAPHIPANALSCRPHNRIVMPRFPSGAFMAEAWVEADAVTVTPPSQPGAAPTITSSGDVGWVEVTIGLLGGLGTMEPLGLSVAATADAPGQDPDKPAPRVWLTPAPEDVLPRALAEAAMLRARQLADKMGLQGLVQIDACVNLEDGQLCLLEVDVTPSLALDSPLYRQAATHPTRPLGPVQLLREVVTSGLRAQRSSDPGLLGEGGAGDEEELDADSLAALAEFEEAQGLGGDDYEESGADGGMLDSLAALQGAGGRGGGEDDDYGGSAEGDIYMSSTGRPARRPRGRPPRSAAPGGDDSMGGYDGAPTRVVGDADFDIDRKGRGPEDYGAGDYREEWGIRNQ